MATFDHIRGDDFRACLEADYNELRTTVGAEAWKAAHVLAGSIVEAMLIDHLIESGCTKPDPLGMTLGQAIDACAKGKIISLKAAALANAIREYRNLVHPGRQVRLDEKVDKNGAHIAMALVEMIADETSTKKQESYGYTAEQVLSKLESDPGALPILRHLLKQPSEVERLLLKVIPSRFAQVAIEFDPFEEGTRDTEGIMRLLRETYRSAFSLAEDSVTTKTMARYVTILKEESGEYVTAYEDAFVRSPDFAYLAGDDLVIVKEHILSRIKSGVDIGILRILEGPICNYLSRAEVGSLMDALVRAIVAGKPDSVRRQARQVVEGFYEFTGEKQDQWIVARLKVWVKHFDDNNQLEWKTIAEAIKNIFEPPISEVEYDPFAEE
jgi:hypothetical protein